jgi:WD40 repeat protein
VFNIWDVETGAQKLSLEHNQVVHDIAISHSGRVVASGTYRTILLWDLETGVCKATLMEDGFFTIDALAFSQDDLLLASPRQLWDTTRLQEQDVSDRHSSDIPRIVWSPNGQLLAVIDAGEVSLWRTTVPSHLHSPQFNANTATSASNGQLLSLAGNMVGIRGVTTGFQATYS